MDNGFQPASHAPPLRRRSLPPLLPDRRSSPPQRRRQSPALGTRHRRRTSLRLRLGPNAVVPMAAGVPLRLAGESSGQRGVSRRRRVRLHGGSGERADGGGDEHGSVVSGSGLPAGEARRVSLRRRRVSGYSVRRETSR